MSLKRQVNVGFELDVADQLAHFAHVFHQDELAPVVRNLTLFALRQIRSLEDYLNVLNTLAASPVGPFERQAEIARSVAEQHQALPRRRARRG